MNKSRVRYGIALLLLVLTPSGCLSSPPTAGDDIQRPTAMPAVLAATSTEQPTALPEATHTLAPTTTPTPKPPEGDDPETRPPNRVITPTATPTIGLLPPTAPATAVPPIDNTLVFYATIVTVQSAPDQPATTSWALRTLPPLPQFDPAAFDDLYGPWQGEFDFSLFLADRQPQLSPDGQTLLVPGLTAYPQYDVEGTGTWMIDLMTGAARQLFADGVIATWSPAGDAITYVEGDTLYTLSTAEGATPQAIFQHPDLWDLYAKWSPDGQWIAAVSGVQHEPTGEAGTDLTFTYWLVPPGGGPARELAQLETYGAGYSADGMSWSPDGQFLLIHNRVYDLAGNLLLTGDAGRLEWLPDRPQLIYLTDGTLRIITPTGDEIARIQGVEARAISWAFSPNGRRLAFGQPREAAGIPIAIYDFDSGETQRIGMVPDAVYIYPLRWSADDSLLVFTVGASEGSNDLWMLPAAPGGTAERLLADAALIEVLPYR